MKLVEKFARELLASRGAAAADAAGSPEAQRMFDTLLRSMPAVGAMAERAARAAGLEFTPPPEETLARARASFAPRNCLLLKFSDDELDQNAELLAAMEAAPVPPATEKRAGNHLTPVVLRLGGGALGAVNPALGRAVGDVRVGDEAAAQQLGRDIAAWLMKAR